MLYGYLRNLDTYESMNQKNMAFLQLSNCKYPAQKQLCWVFNNIYVAYERLYQGTQVLSEKLSASGSSSSHATVSICLTKSPLTAFLHRIQE